MQDPTEFVSEGSVIEVEWSLRTRGRKQKKVWWGAKVLSTAKPDASGEHRLTGNLFVTLQYQSEHGFDQSVSTAKLFKNNSLLDIDSGNMLRWRFGEQLALEQTISSAGEDSFHKKDCKENMLSRSKSEPRLVCDESPPGPNINEDISKLFQKVSYLERQILNCRGSSSATGPIFGNIVCDYLFQRVGLKLDKPLSSKITKSETGREVSSLVQDYVTARADCSLEQFLQLSRLCEEKNNPNTIFLPSVEAVRISTGRDKELSIHFGTYYDLCNTLAPSMSTCTNSTILKWKKTRHDSGSSVIRVLGTLADSASEDSIPSTKAVLVGSSLYRRSENMSSTVVLTRESDEYDYVNCSYSYPLEARVLSSREMQENFELPDSKNFKLANSFSLTWKPVQGPRPYGTFERVLKNVVLGTAYLNLPACIFSGHTICSELDTIGHDVIVGQNSSPVDAPHPTVHDVASE